MDQTQFSRRQVDRSFQKFNDLVADLNGAAWQTWGDTLGRLIHHCQNDPVMKVVTEPLLLNGNVNAKTWVEEAFATVGSMIGSGRYTLPRDDEDRTALLYQFLLMVERAEVNFPRFCVDMYGAMDRQESVRIFNQEIVVNFTREVGHRLREIQEDLGTQSEVSQEALVVFHHHDHSMNIHGNIQGSNVAAAGSTISGSNASYASTEELATALEALRPLIHDVTEAQRSAVEGSLQLLINSLSDPKITGSQAEAAAETVASSSVGIRAKLMEIAGKIGIGVISSAGASAIKGLLGTP